jgi:poly(hydroxyalkanoate) depolymerase family esterase
VRTRFKTFVAGTTLVAATMGTTAFMSEQASATPTASHAGTGAAPTSTTAFPGPGQYLHRKFNDNGDIYKYSLYIPSTYRPSAAAPLVVLLHGCNTTADLRAASSQFDQVAEQNGVIALYPDGDTIDRTLNKECWRAADLPAGETRGHGDAGAIAGMTHAVMAAWHIDPQRVYAMGMSSGGFETSMLGADYPDLYAAIGVFSGAAYDRGPVGCLGTWIPAADTTSLAEKASAQMGPRQRVVPAISFHGDADKTVPYQCGRQALEQWRQTDNSALTARGLVPIAQQPTEVTNATTPSGQAYTVENYDRGAGDCLALQFWTVHGMGHQWSGGSSDPAYATMTDPDGPDASQASWRFFNPIRMGAACAHG